MTSEDINGESTNVTTRVDVSFLEEFDRTLKKAQIEGEIPMNASRAEIVRGLMKLATEDPSLLPKALEEDQS